MSFHHLRRVARAPDCHPEREHHAKGMCRRCYQRKLGAELYHGVRIAKPKKVTVWPQAIVRGIPPGWGSIG